MANALARMTYVALLAMHPRSFRRDFAGEMLRVFDEATADEAIADKAIADKAVADETVAGYGAGWLLGELALSVLRQRLLRDAETGQHGLTPLACGGVGLRSGVYPLVAPVEFLEYKLLVACLLTCMLFQVIGPI